MEERIHIAVERAIEAMQKRLDEEITIDDMARAAMFSKFHFTRIFQRVTGVSPGRFLSALRLQRAKQLLVSTPWSVADISQRVGYSSVGTFSTRFKRSVGLSPTNYRRRGGFTDRIGYQPDGQIEPGGTVYGTLRSHLSEHAGDLYVGVFPGPVPEERPISCAVLSRPGEFVLSAVPEGIWYVLACGDVRTEASMPGNPFPVAQTVTAVGMSGPFHITHGVSVVTEVWMRPKRMTDPPILTALLSNRRALQGAVPSNLPIATAA